MFAKNGVCNLDGLLFDTGTVNRDFHKFIINKGFCKWIAEFVTDWHSVKKDITICIIQFTISLHKHLFERKVFLLILAAIVHLGTELWILHQKHHIEHILVISFFYSLRVILLFDRWLHKGVKAAHQIHFMLLID